MYKHLWHSIKHKPIRYIVDYKAHYWHEYVLHIREMDKIEMNRRLLPPEYYNHRKAILNARRKTLQDKEGNNVSQNPTTRETEGISTL